MTIRLLFFTLLLLCAVIASVAQNVSAPQSGCIPGVTRIADKRLRLPVSLRPFVPKEAYVTFVAPLSGTDTLILYEMGNWKRHWEKFRVNQDGAELTDPDTHITIFRSGKKVFNGALKEFRFKGLDEDWGIAAEVMNVAHLCGETPDLTYMVLQAGNAGGFFVALHNTGDGYKVVPISAASQGRLVLSKVKPRNAEVWSAADAGVCTACPKPFLIQTFEFDGNKFRIVSRRSTTKEFSGFQDEPLVVRP